jgi:NACHT domain/Restriction endonuclease
MTKKTSKPQKSQAWLGFERQVTAVLSLKGFDPIPDVQVAGRQTDVITLRSREEHVGSIIVECKFSGARNPSKVDVRDVEDFIGRVIRLRNSGDINSGYLVTNTGFTHEARGTVFGRPEANFVFLRTYTELLRSIINFRPYLERLVDGYETIMPERLYEPLDAQLMPPVIVETTQEERSVFRKWTEVVLHDFRVGERQPLLSIVNKFLDDAEQRVLAIVGDYGTGKTTSCKHIAHLAAMASAAESAVGRIPCFIPLSYYSDAGTTRALITRFLTDDVGVRTADYSAFRAMNEAGLLLLILDGFDEMGRRITRHVRRELFRELGDLVCPDSKVVISGRPGYFANHSELYSAVIAMSQDSPVSMIYLTERQRKLELPQSTRLCQMSPLAEEQVLDFIEKRLQERGVADPQTQAKQMVR